MFYATCDGRGADIGITSYMAELQNTLGAPIVPRVWGTDGAEQEAFLKRIAHAPVPLLICDYDGTLAPFQEDKMQAVVYPGVVERLQALAQGRTRIAFVSGRPVHELIELLPLAAGCEVWGMHGREHRLPNGTVRTLEPSTAQRAALDAAEARLSEEGLASSVERKTASVALHWRSLEARAKEIDRLHAMQTFAREVFCSYAGRDGLSLLPFDGGVELRADDHTKGHATAALLAAGEGRAAAFLGDDTTDEDAFGVMRVHGELGLLVREPSRPSLAHFSLKPPEQLLAFLDSWLAAVTEY